jgi:hypothetical protein
MKRGGGKERYHFIPHPKGQSPAAPPRRRHLRSHHLHDHLDQHTEEEEEARILKGNVSISIINVFIAIPFVYVVVIRTLLGFTHICNCTFILILL